MIASDDRLPHFIIIGAAKAATTWIAHQLRHHPDLWLPDAEPHFFSTEYHRGLRWYKSLFRAAPAGRIVGEKSASYLIHPDAAARIAQILPHVPLIIQLRNPIDRAYSDYCMYYRRGMVDADLRRYLDARRAGETRFLNGGRYAHHINTYLKHVPAAQLKIILYDDILTNAERVIAEVCDHIGVPVHIVPQAISDRRNDSKAPMLPLAMRRILKPARTLLEPLRSNEILAQARRALARPIAYPPLTPELRTMLQDYYRDDIDHLAEILGRDMSAWHKEDMATV